MAIYTIKCQDGGDPQCLKTLEVSIPIIGLNTEQLQSIIDDSECRITKKQMIDNNIKPNQGDKESLDETDLMTFEYEVESICSACGSDYTRNDDGKIIDE
jgi:hypothetical protein